MLERYVTEALAQHFGHFVEGLDKEQVRLSTWTGEINLQNLQIKKTALDALFRKHAKSTGGGAPVEILHGQVGNLQVSIPWTVLRSQLTWRGQDKNSGGNATGSGAHKSPPVSIVLTDVNLLIAPRRRDTVASPMEEVNEEEDGESSEDRETEIQAALDAELLRRVAASSSNSTDAKKASWIQDRLTSLLENLSVTVRNIHIRYEDTGHSMGFTWTATEGLSSSPSSLPEATVAALPIHRYRPSFCVGITLKEFAIRAAGDAQDSTADTTAGSGTNDLPTADSAAGQRKVRVAAAQALAIYWDSDTPIMCEEAVRKRVVGPEFFQTAFQALQSGPSERGWSPRAGFAPQHAFVLDPFSPTITFSLASTSASQEAPQKPRLPSSVHSHLPPCRFAVSRNLLEDLGYLRKSYAIWKQRNTGHISEAALRHLAELRPRCSPALDPRGWWHYVLEAIAVVHREEVAARHREHGRPYAQGRRRRRGWLGLGRLLALRKEYVAAFATLVNLHSSEDSLSVSHERLNSLEEDLDISEVVAFRIHAYSWLRDAGVISEAVPDDVKPKSLGRWKWSGQSPRSTSKVGDENKFATLETSTSHSTSEQAGVSLRLRSFYEMGQAVEREKSNVTTKRLEEEELDRQSMAYGIGNALNPVAWETRVSCGEISLQVNDRRVVHRHRDKPAPVVRLSCALNQEQSLYRDGSWEYQLGIGSLKVKDCTHRSSRTKNARTFPYLIGPKRGYDFEGERITVNGEEHSRIILLEIFRSQHSFRSTALGSTTRTSVRVLPLEICYLTSPVEALSRILGTANIDFANDYMRLSSSLFAWREKQKRRLLAALSEQNKRILVNVDLQAPTVIIPEGQDTDSPVLLVDLGHLAFSNDEGRISSISSSADHWHLTLSRVQVQCSTTEIAARRSPSQVPHRSLGSQQIIEPFSLNFAVTTRFHGQVGDTSSSFQDQIVIVATLPRLVFNMSASAVRLLRRLQSQWNQRKLEIKGSLLLPSRVFGGLTGRQQSFGLTSLAKARQTSGKSNRLIQFRFAAPLLRLKFENDVDGRDFTEKGALGERSATPILDLSLRGIEGEIQNERVSDGLVRHSFQAKLRSVDAKDLYQKGGEQFSLLLSSIPPDALRGILEENGMAAITTDLVSIRYTSSDQAGAAQKETEIDHGCNRLYLHFHELFVEWNPDTIAAVHYAIREAATSEFPGAAASDEEDDMFYDAEEEEFLDAGSIESDDSDNYLISEISSHRSSYSDLSEAYGNPHSFVIPNSSLMYPSSRGFLGSWNQMGQDFKSPELKEWKRLEIEFELSKLRINFNKETRRRRVFAAEVDHTAVSFSTRREGGYRSKVVLGNLTLADAGSDFDATLYREIMGLKADAVKSAGESSSLLEMTLVKNPRVRSFVDGGSWGCADSSMEEHVVVDLAQGSVRGCDLFLSAQLSPMRFVYLQQLWLEIVDYVFDGVIGSEVWGNKRPVPGSVGPFPSEQAHAEAVIYTNFRISMHAPVILVPVTYCSTDFLRFETEAIAIANSYDYRPMRLDATGATESTVLQWFNNCAVNMTGITLSSWSGNVLSQIHDTINCDICIDWPSGPLASRNKPKWRVSCKFDELRLALFKEDYALLQQIVGSNISEGSRHLDEWRCLQSLPSKTREAYMSEIFVFFGYDKKDVTPSTFDVTVSFPLLLFALKESGHGQIAVAQCSDVIWKYQKFSDRVSRQHVGCEISLIGRNGDGEKMMLSSHDIWSSRGESPKSATLSYKSTTAPSGDNTKELAINDGCIHVGYQPWRAFAEFFSHLPSPSFLSPREVIQVGDRWYKISDGRTEETPVHSGPLNDWILRLGSSDSASVATASQRKDPEFNFYLRLGQPRIALKSTEFALMLAMESIALHNFGQSGLIMRKLSLSGVEVQTMSQRDTGMDRGASLISPLLVSGEIRRCNGKGKCLCSVHTTSVTIERINATAAFSDLVRSAVVLRQLKDDIYDVAKATASSPKAIYSNSEVDRVPVHPAPESSTPDSVLSIALEGIEMSLVDDSGRHFADSQELIHLSMLNGSFLAATRSSTQGSSDCGVSTIFALEKMQLDDCLQSKASPFRTVLSINPGDTYESFLSGADLSLLKRWGGDSTRGVEMSQFSSSDSSKYVLGAHFVEMQYNPSMVVALQRFLGRLFKTINNKIMKSYGRSPDTAQRTETTNFPETGRSTIEAAVFLKTATISLNKEHQGRCLLHVRLADIRLAAQQNDYVAQLKGAVGFFSATDANDYELQGGIHRGNRALLKMRKDADSFLEFEYRSFRKRSINQGFDSFGLPSWVLSYSNDQLSEIDDYLELAVASVEVVYLSSRTSELVDYLSNGLPGRGMGATSRAAKGFVADRIQKKSFLQVNVDAPIVLVPRNENENAGLVFGGEVRSRSWIEMADATRKLSVSVGSLVAGVYAGKYNEAQMKSILSDVDVTIDVSRDIADNTVAACCFSDIFARLSYTDYASFVYVVRDNLGRKIDRTQWDNVEAAWENETISEVSSFTHESPRAFAMPSFSMDVAYSSDARRVRYGQGRRSAPHKRAARMDLTVALDDVSVVLKRDDGADYFAHQAYDMMLFRAQGFEASLTSVDDGSSASFSIHRLFLFDTGAKGRRLRNMTSSGSTIPEESVVVLVEGYAPPQMNEKRPSDKKSSQLIVRVDKNCLSGASEYRASIVLNHLSVAALFQPFQELSEFLRMDWSRSPVNESFDTASLDGLTGDDQDTGQTNLPTAPNTEERRFHVQLVLHYPRFILAATDGDVHSRALVLRGLAILKGSRTLEASDATGEILKINADFQHVSSHIVPDAADILCIASRHYDLVTGPLPEYADVYHQDKRQSPMEKIDDLGVALLLPVTVGVEFEQIVSSLAEIRTKRSFALNMDPLSVLLSAEDLHLIRSLLARWVKPQENKKKKAESALRHFEVVFNSQKLGLGLRRDSRSIVVDAAHDISEVCVGDILYSIDGAILADSVALPLAGVVERLRQEPRPLRLGFVRKCNEDDQSDIAEDTEPSTLTFSTSADLSFSEATVTLIDQDVSLLRGKIAGTRITYSRTENESLLQKVSLQSTLSVDYYNLRIWQWEPLLEPGSLYASGEYSDPALGPRSLALEMGDRDSIPLSLNLSDASALVLSKLQEWRRLSDDPSIERVAFSDQAGQAANVALQFAKRQKHSAGKPLVFQNKSGLSCAFAVQKMTVETRPTRQAVSLLGEYHGLQSYTDSEIYIVAPESECKFRVDRASGSRRSDGQGLRPCLKVAFQSIVGTILEPITDLQIVRPGESLVSLAYKPTGGSDDGAISSVWLSWKVEPTDEKTVLTLGSAFRVTSQLRTTPVEVGVALEDGRIKSLGFIPEKRDLHLPVWLSVKSRFQLFVKPSGMFEFAPLFEFSQEQPGSEESQGTKYIECFPKRDSSSSIWLASRMFRKGSVVIVSIDCCLTLLNMLPVPLQWEVSSGVGRERQAIDGSTKRDTPIMVGKFAEVLGSQHGSLYLRLKYHEWSNWVSLPSLLKGVESHFQNIELKDVFGVPLVVGLRTTRPSIGMHVTFFAETWFMNATTLNLSFGAPASIIMPQDGFRTAISGFEEMSAAEAALKEFSALFEAGEGGKDIRSERNRQASKVDVCLLPAQAGTVITEECYEYIEVEGSVVKRRWWGTENPYAKKPNVTSINEDGENWRWIDSKWSFDSSSKHPDAWESAARLQDFRGHKGFDPSHKSRRRRWYRRRRSDSGLVTAFSQGVRGIGERKSQKKSEVLPSEVQYALRVEGGRWAMTSQIPEQGVVYGAVRAPSTKGLGRSDGKSEAIEVFELCYAVLPLEGEWGDLSRLMIVSSRFLIRNDSSASTFEVKQVGCPDSTACVISPGGSHPFHWADLQLPALICIRPLLADVPIPCYKWSGGVDPLTVGVTPVRIREITDTASHSMDQTSAFRVQSVKVETAIRPRSGGAGINISFKEEDEEGYASLFRIDNRTPFPVWFAQDGLLANPTSVSGWHADGDLLRPDDRMPFALDVPFRQGKYSGRKAASIDELLRVRLSLAPLNCRVGIEATRVVSLSGVGETVRLNPSKLSVLDRKARTALHDLRVIGVVTNDGPTRVLNLVLMKKEDHMFSNPFREELSMMTSFDTSIDAGSFSEEIVNAAKKAILILGKDRLSVPSQEVAIKGAMMVASLSKAPLGEEQRALLEQEPYKSSPQDLIISVRIAFGGFTFSLVDSAPAEIAVITLKNVNAIASWNTRRTTDSTIYVTVSHLQIDNMVPNAPYAVAFCPADRLLSSEKDDGVSQEEVSTPLLVVGVSVAPRHRSGVEVVKSVTIAPKNLAIRADLAFLVRLQKYVIDLQQHFARPTLDEEENGIILPNLQGKMDQLNAAARSGENSRMYYFGALTILPCSIHLSVAPARALTPIQASLEGAEAAAIHQAVKKGDLKLGDEEVLLGVKIGHRNDTPLAVVRGVFKSIVVDALLRLDGASLNFSGISLKNHVATSPQMLSYIAAHYITSLRKNMPALVGSLAALGNPVGLVRGLGDGVSDFVLEPVKGFQRSVQEMDASYLVDGVARGTLSLARHTVGGFANSAAALTETFSKNMTVLTLDRKYAQQRDRGDDLRNHQGDMNVALGLGSGVQKLVHGFLDGVTGVVKAPIRGAEKRGLEGFAKGVGKGLLGLLVKPLVGISDGLTDVMIGVKGSVDGASGGQSGMVMQIRPRRPVYGRDRAIRAYNMADAAALALMQRTRLAGELYLSHLDMGDRLALLSIKRILLMGPLGDEVLVLKYKHIERAEMQAILMADGTPGWGIILVLNTARRNGSEVEVINCREQWQATALLTHIEEGIRLNFLTTEAVELSSSVSNS